jgi:hypothetical protein
MAIMTASAGEQVQRVGQASNPASKALIYESIGRLSGWLEEHDYRGYDTFDGLSARFLRPFTFNTKVLRIVLQQSVRRLPVNLRPVLGITREHSSKGMGFHSARLHAPAQNDGRPGMGRQGRDGAASGSSRISSKGYSGACWGNHFDYQSRGFYLPKGVPTIVWSSLIGHAFLDGYEHFNKAEYLQIAESACGHILRDYEAYPHGQGLCFSYVPGLNSQVHNANTLAASLLARTHSHMPNPSLPGDGREGVPIYGRAPAVLTDRGGTPNILTASGSITFILATFSIASNTTSKPPETIALQVNDGYGV